MNIKAVLLISFALRWLYVMIFVAWSSSDVCYPESEWVIPSPLLTGRDIKLGSIYDNGQLKEQAI